MKILKAIVSAMITGLALYAKAHDADACVNYANSINVDSPVLKSNSIIKAFCLNDSYNITVTFKKKPNDADITEFNRLSDKIACSSDNQAWKFTEKVSVYLTYGERLLQINKYSKEKCQ